MAVKKMTIADIAQELGISKTTVSRSISGKGRISEETRQRVLQFIKEKEFSPNVVARGLAVSRTYNICAVLPNDNNLVDMPFFQECLTGIVKAAEECRYDILVCMMKGDNISQLKRIVSNQKVDGVILMRPLVEDLAVEYLRSIEIPFLVIGSKQGVIQVDNNHEEACQSLTSLLITKGMKKIGLIGSSLEQCITHVRYRGYCAALSAFHMPLDKNMVYLEAMTDDEIQYYANILVQQGADCIIGMDDYICRCIYRQIKRISESGGKTRPVLASFYDNDYLGEQVPCALSVRCNITEIGATSSRVIIDMIEGREVEERTVLGYDIVAR